MVYRYRAIDYSDPNFGSADRPLHQRSKLNQIQRIHELLCFQELVLSMPEVFRVLQPPEKWAV
jgi:hypothetical protein